MHKKHKVRRQKYFKRIPGCKTSKKQLRKEFLDVEKGLLSYPQGQENLHSKRCQKQEKSELEWGSKNRRE